MGAQNHTHMSIQLYVVQGVDFNVIEENDTTVTQWQGCENIIWWYYMRKLKNVTGGDNFLMYNQWTNECSIWL